MLTQKLLPSMQWKSDPDLCPLLFPQACWALVLLDVLCLCRRDFDAAAVVPAQVVRDWFRACQADSISRELFRKTYGSRGLDEARPAMP
jgi:hypothetical protein